MLAFVDYDYNAKTNTFKMWPKIPNAWSYLGSRVKVKNGNVYDHLLRKRALPAAAIWPPAQ